MVEGRNEAAISSRTKVESGTSYFTANTSSLRTVAYSSVLRSSGSAQKISCARYSTKSAKSSASSAAPSEVSGKVSTGFMAVLRPALALLRLFEVMALRVVVGWERW